MNIEEYIQNYCYSNLLDTPASKEEYLAYADRLAAVGILSNEQVKQFRELVINDKEFIERLVI